MLLIAHRGNLLGRDPNRENSPDFILQALSAGYHCEIDLRVKNGNLYLGHDEPQYLIEEQFLVENQDKLWIHCKDKEAFDYCLGTSFHYFWHDTDDYTLTSKGYVWAYPGQPPVGNNCIMVMPEYKIKWEEAAKMNPLGICSDWVGILKA